MIYTSSQALRQHQEWLLGRQLAMDGVPLEPPEPINTWQELDIRHVQCQVAANVAWCPIGNIFVLRYKAPIRLMSQGIAMPLAAICLQLHLEASHCQRTWCDSCWVPCTSCTSCHSWIWKRRLHHCHHKRLQSTFCLQVASENGHHLCLDSSCQNHIHQVSCVAWVWWSPACSNAMCFYVMCFSYGMCFSKSLDSYAMCFSWLLLPHERWLMILTKTQTTKTFTLISCVFICYWWVISINHQTKHINCSTIMSPSAPRTYDLHLPPWEDSSWNRSTLIHQSLCKQISKHPHSQSQAKKSKVDHVQDQHLHVDHVQDRHYQPESKLHQMPRAFLQESSSSFHCAWSQGPARHCEHLAELWKKWTVQLNQSSTQSRPAATLAIATSASLHRHPKPCIPSERSCHHWSGQM